MAQKIKAGNQAKESVNLDMKVRQGIFEFNFPSFVIAPSLTSTLD
jgi:hypothetical protein